MINILENILEKLPMEQVLAVILRYFQEHPDKIEKLLELIIDKIISDLESKKVTRIGSTDSSRVS